MRFQRLADWLQWQESLHPSAIDMGLERVAKVRDRLGLAAKLDVPVVAVAGTNGKGSCVRYMESALQAAGYRVGAYTSPHLWRYNERIRVDGEEIRDEQLCQAFAEVDQARGDVSLTYFEFGTLAAVQLFRTSYCDVMLLEVGLGGRLDAVNVFDANVAVITSIGIDHVEWLGSDRATIATEKAGIFRTDRPAVCGDVDPPATLLAQADKLGVPLYRCGRDFNYHLRGRDWDWLCEGVHRRTLPLPAMRGEHQLRNAASAIMALHLLRHQLPVDQSSIRRGLLHARLPGRAEVHPGQVEELFDVGHNAQAAITLARALAEQSTTGVTRVVLGMLRDKDVGEYVAALNGLNQQWYCGGLNVTRGLAGEELADLVKARLGGAAVRGFVTVAEALRIARSEAQAGDRIVVTGSFYSVAQSTDA